MLSLLSVAAARSGGCAGAVFLFSSVGGLFSFSQGLATPSAVSSFCGSGGGGGTGVVFPF